MNHKNVTIKRTCMAVLTTLTALSFAATRALADGAGDVSLLYCYNGDVRGTDAAAALDGTWNHDNNSDEWDGSDIGGTFGPGNAPGGASIFNDPGATDGLFIRVQDTGDPRTAGFSDPGSNRKVTFGHALSLDGVPTDKAILDDGDFVLQFRARLATSGTIDPIYTAATPVPFPAGGDGYIIHDSGKSQFLVHQEPTGAGGGDGTISFCLALESDHPDFAGQFGGPSPKGALVTNYLNGTTRSGAVDSGEAGTISFVPIDDVTAWHTYTIRFVAGGAGTHIVSVSVDDTAPVDLEVTLGTGNDLGSENNIGFGMGRTGASAGGDGHGCLDVDFIGYGICSDKITGYDPEDGQDNVPIDADLSWNPPCDPNDVDWTFDVYFGTTVPDGNCDGMSLVSADQVENMYDPGTLVFDTTYYWRIDAIDPNGGGAPIVLKGDCLSFTTLPESVVITDQPAGQTVDAGDDAVFTIGQLNGDTFKWRKNGVDLADDAKYSGTTTDTLTVTDVQLADEGNYSVVVSNDAPSEETSTDAQLLTCRLIGHWKLDNNLLDSVALTVPGAPTHDGSVLLPTSVGEVYITGADGTTDGAYDFTGGSGRGLEPGDPNNNTIVIADSTAYFNFADRGLTISAWVRDTTVGGGHPVTDFDALVAKEQVCCGNTDPNFGFSTGWVLTIQPGNEGEFAIRGGASPDTPTGSTLRDGEWHMVTGVYNADTGTATTYMDGVAAESASSIGPRPNFGPLIFGAEEVLDGADGTSDSRPGGADSELDEVRIYSCPLSPTQVAALYTDFTPADDSICAFDDPADDVNPYDFNNDCTVNLLDFAALAGRFLDNNCIPGPPCI